MHGCSAIGIVRAFEGNRVAVEFAAPPRCKGCGGACLWYRVPPSERLLLPADGGELPVGATVTVTLPDRYLLLGAVFVYGVPLLALLLGAVTGSAIFADDLAAAAGAGLGLCGALLATSWCRRSVEQALLRRLAVRCSA